MFTKSHELEEKIKKSLAWSTAIGLQQVDGLTPSKYLSGKETLEQLRCLQ